MHWLALLLFLTLPARARDERPPNVLLIVADDQAYAVSPICNLSRMALMAGVAPLRFGSRWYGGKGLHLEGHPGLSTERPEQLARMRAALRAWREQVQR